MLGGPVLLFDAVRTARRARHVLLRAGYGLLLLIILFLVYTDSFGDDVISGLAGIMDEQSVPPRAIARFTADFFHTFLVVQFLAVLLLTPAFTGGAIAEEREKGTLPLLLTTDLLPREIVLGKLVARLGHLVLLLLSSAPILSLLQLLGGIDPALLAAVFGLTLLTALGVGSLALLCSAHCDRPRDAVFLTYVYIAFYQVLTGFCGVLAGQALDSVPEFLLGVIGSGNLLIVYFQLTQLSESGNLGSDLPLLLLQYLTFHGCLSAICLRRAMAVLRRPEAPGRQDLSSSARIAAVLREKLGPLHPPLGRRGPMLWKECYLERGLELHPVGRLIMSMAVVLFVTLAATILFCGVLIGFVFGGISAFTNTFLCVCVPLLAGVGMLGLALRAAGTFTGERERQTLDSLLTTDLTKTEILWGKFCGCLWQLRHVGTVLAALLCLGLVTGGLHPLLGPVELLVLAVHGAFAVCLGMYCSLLSRTTWQATVATAVVLLSVTLGHLLILLVVTTVCHWLGRPEVAWDLRWFHAYGLTPPVTQWTFLEPLNYGLNRDPRQTPAALLGIGFYAGLTALLWGLLHFRFASKTGRAR